MQDDLLWVYEGQTQFWGYVLAARSGMMSSRTCAMRSPHRAPIDGTPGREWRPLIDTTNDPIVPAGGLSRGQLDAQRGLLL